VCTHPKTDAEVAYKYKRVISALDPKIENHMLMRISILENEVRGRGEKPEDDPITLITEAVGIVLEEESNLEILKALKSRRALNTQGRFDPQRNTRNEGTPSHGQTWATDGAVARPRTPRRCATACSARPKVHEHAGAQRPARRPRLTERHQGGEGRPAQGAHREQSKAKRDAWKARKAAKAERRQGWHRDIDDVDAAAADRIFAQRQQRRRAAHGVELDHRRSDRLQLDQGRTFAHGVDELAPIGRLARTHTDAPSVMDATSVSTMLSPDARAPSLSAGATNTATSAFDDTHVYVLKPCGDETYDAVSSGIPLCGRWKQEVLPGIIFALEQEKLPFDRKSSSRGARSKSTRSRRPSTSVRPSACRAHLHGPLALLHG